MKFCWATVHVKNMEESLKFYQEAVGLNMKNRYANVPGKEMVFLGDGETQIELICDAALKEVNLGQDISLGFEVKSVEETMAKLAGLGIPIHSGPFQPSPHVSFFYVLDPDGLKIQFVENK